jgi:hypothetical protein
VRGCSPHEVGPFYVVKFRRRVRGARRGDGVRCISPSLARREPRIMLATCSAASDCFAGRGMQVRDGDGGRSVAAFGFGLDIAD